MEIYITGAVVTFILLCAIRAESGYIKTDKYCFTVREAVICCLCAVLWFILVPFIALHLLVTVMYESR